MNNSNTYEHERNGAMDMSSRNNISIREYNQIAEVADYIYKNSNKSIKEAIEEAKVLIINNRDGE